MLNVPFFSQYQNFNVINFFLLLQFLDLNIQIINYLVYTTIIPILRSASIIRKMDLLTKNNSIYRTLADSSRSNPLFQTTVHTTSYLNRAIRSVAFIPTKFAGPPPRESINVKEQYILFQLSISFSTIIFLLSSFSHVPRRCVPRANSTTNSVRKTP